MVSRRSSALATLAVAAACSGDPAGDEVIVQAASIGCPEEYRWAAVARQDGSEVVAGVELAAGPARLAVDAGDSVTASVGPAGPLETVMWAAPGDALTFGELCVTDHATGIVRVTWAAVAGATSYQVCSTCDCRRAAELASDVFTCTDGGPDQEDLVVVARAGDVPTAYAWRAGAPVVDHGTVDAGPWRPPTDVTITVDALPGFDPHGLSIVVRNRAQVVSSETVSAALPATITRPAPSDGLALRVVTGIDRELNVLSIPPGTRAATLSVIGRMPQVSDFSYDPATRRVRFAVAGDAPYDYALIGLRWPLPAAPHVYWTVIVPRFVTSFVLPRHPALLTAPIDDVAPVADIALVEREDLADHDAVRRTPLVQLTSEYGTVRAGFTGLLRWADFSP